MKRYEVNLRDYETGATSPIEVIEAADDYTAEQYIKDCERCADQDYIDMLNTGEVILYEID